MGNKLAPILVNTLRVARQEQLLVATLREQLSVALEMIHDLDRKMDAAREQSIALREENRRLRGTTAA